MALKKSELYSSLWKSCDKLRGGMDASQYKDYVLVFLFVKYVSDKYAGDPNALIDVPKGGGHAGAMRGRGQPNRLGASLGACNGLHKVNPSIHGPSSQHFRFNV